MPAGIENRRWRIIEMCEGFFFLFSGQANSLSNQAFRSLDEIQLYWQVRTLKRSLNFPRSGLLTSLNSIALHCIALKLHVQQQRAWDIEVVDFQESTRGNPESHHFFVLGTRATT